MTWTYHNPTHLHLGNDVLGRLGEIRLALPNSDRKVALITGRSSASKYGHLDAVLAALGTTHVAVFEEVEAEPSQQTALRARAFIEDENAGQVVALGGGSALDVAKVATTLAYAPGEVSLADLMDRTAPVPKRSIPLIALPTTAGSGSEMTPFSVLSKDHDGSKQSLPSAEFYPDAALVYPGFLATVTSKVAGDSGMDALAHALEAIWSTRRNPVSDALAYRSVRFIHQNFLNYYRDPENSAAALAMAQAATLAGKAFSNTFTAGCHALSYPLGRTFGLSHGGACGLTLHLFASVNSVAVAEQFAELKKYLNTDESIPSIVQGIRDEVRTIPTLRELNATEEDFLQVARASFRPLMANNPVTLTDEAVAELLSQEWERR